MGSPLYLQKNKYGIEVLLPTPPPCEAPRVPDAIPAQPSQADELAAPAWWYDCSGEFPIIRLASGGAFYFRKTGDNSWEVVSV